MCVCMYIYIYIYIYIYNKPGSLVAMTAGIGELSQALDTSFRTHFSAKRKTRAFVSYRQLSFQWK